MAKINKEFELISSGGYIDSQKEVVGTIEEPKTITAYFEIKTYTFIAYPQANEPYERLDPESGSLYSRMKTYLNDEVLRHDKWQWHFDTEEQYHDYYEKWNKNRAQVEKDLRKLLNIEGETTFGLWNLLDEIFTVVTTKRINTEEN